MERNSTPNVPVAPRSSQEIFDDLRALAQSDGALHEISAIIYRDCVVTVDLREARITDAPGHRWSTSKLNNNELMLLIGLMVQSKSDRIYSVQATNNTFAAQADRLLREFHDRVNFDIPSLEAPIERSIDPDELFSIGPFAREAIYYGANSFYIHQFSKFTRLRYRDDHDWLLQNIEVSIRPLIEIARFITDRINQRINASIQNAGRQPNHVEMTDSLLISKNEVRKSLARKRTHSLPNSRRRSRPRMPVSTMHSLSTLWRLRQ